MKNIIYYKDKRYKGYIIYMPMYAKCDPYKVSGTFYEWEGNGKRGLYHIETSTHYNDNGITQKQFFESCERLQKCGKIRRRGCTGYAVEIND